MKKTIDWFDLLPEGTRHAAFAETRLEKLNAEYPSFEQAMLAAFIWSITPEGHEFWHKLSETIK